MKTFLSSTLLLTLALCACAPKQPPVPPTEAPAGPLVRALEERRESFRGLTALANVEVRKWGRKQVLENVGIVLDRAHRFRIEAYGPLGQSVLSVVWNGSAFFYRLPEHETIKQGREGFDEILGEGVEAAEIAALLSGNMPALGPKHTAARFCGQNGCTLEFRTGEEVRRFSLHSEKPRFDSAELERAGKVLYRARFSQWQSVADYFLPLRMEFENTRGNLRLSIEYRDVEVNRPISDEAFTLGDRQDH